jgi:hypothetical protein
MHYSRGKTNLQLTKERGTTTRRGETSIIPGIQFSKVWFMTIFNEALIFALIARGD